VPCVSLYFDTWTDLFDLKLLTTSATVRARLMATPAAGCKQWRARQLFIAQQSDQPVAAVAAALRSLERAFR